MFSKKLKKQVIPNSTIVSLATANKILKFILEKEDPKILYTSIKFEDLKNSEQRVRMSLCIERTLLDYSLDIAFVIKNNYSNWEMQPISPILVNYVSFFNEPGFFALVSDGELFFTIDEENKAKLDSFRKFLDATEPKSPDNGPRVGSKN